MTNQRQWSIAIGLLLAAPGLLAAQAPPVAVPAEFKVKRQEVFEFTAPPKVTRNGDRVEITFTTKAYCDVTVAAEDEQGRIVRHLGSGVLGDNAPAPFQKNSLRQVVVWDSKDDQGDYLDDLSRLTIRVSLGLKPRFERTLFWEPSKRVGRANRPLIVAQPEGVYVFEGEGVDNLKLFDHDGNYLRTVYPFPADKLNQVKGLNWQAFPQDGLLLPLKSGPKHYSTFLTSGDNMLQNPGKYGSAATALAIHGPHIALVSRLLNRLGTDGTTGGLDLLGPKTSYVGKVNGYTERGETFIAPRGAAFSPDGKHVYLTGYVWNTGVSGESWLHGVDRLDFAGSEAPQRFVGDLGEKGDGTGDGQFRVATSVACDARGRIYVADYMNDRIQVFTPDGKLYKVIKAAKPAELAIHHKTQEIYVFSWYLRNGAIPNDMVIPATLTRLGTVDEPKKIADYPLPLQNYSGRNGLRVTGLEYHAVLDSHTEPPTIWLVPGTPGTVETLQVMRGQGGDEARALLTHLKLLQEKDGKLVVRRDFGADTAKSVLRTQPPVHAKNRLYVNPVNGKLYVGEGDSGVNKSFMQLVEIDPATGAIKLVNLPFTAEDMCFGIDGVAYLRTDTAVVRYDPRTWTEIPWDYGEELPKVGFDPSIRTAPVKSGLVLPAVGRSAFWHLGGMSISPRGHLVVTCFNSTIKIDRREFKGDSGLAKIWATAGGRKYTPPLYPGRDRYGEVHIWDKHGQLLYEDAVPGLGVGDGIAIDRNDNLYVLASSHRIIDGKPYFLRWTETLFKVAPKKCKLISPSEHAAIPLPRDAWPQRSLEMQGYWIEGAQWVYGGVGFGSQNGGCVCWNTRPTLDYFARTFAPEIDHFSVAVLDTNGNLIMRIGKYGNVDDGRPLQLAGGPKNPRSVGGDEVALCHAAYLNTHTDRRLFIADGGNRRLLSVQLDYHATERVPLRGR